MSSRTFFIPIIAFASLRKADMKKTLLATFALFITLQVAFFCGCKKKSKESKLEGERQDLTQTTEFNIGNHEKLPFRKFFEVTYIKTNLRRREGATVASGHPLNKPKSHYLLKLYFLL